MAIERIAVVGAGAWGSALANAAARAGCSGTLNVAVAGSPARVGRRSMHSGAK